MTDREIGNIEVDLADRESARGVFRACCTLSSGDGKDYLVQQMKRTPVLEMEFGGFRFVFAGKSELESLATNLQMSFERALVNNAQERSLPFWKRMTWKEVMATLVFLVVWTSVVAALL